MRALLSGPAGTRGQVVLLGQMRAEDTPDPQGMRWGVRVLGGPLNEVVESGDSQYADRDHSGPV